MEAVVVGRRGTGRVEEVTVDEVAAAVVRVDLPRVAAGRWGGGAAVGAERRRLGDVAAFVVAQELAAVAAFVLGGLADGVVVRAARLAAVGVVLDLLAGEALVGGDGLAGEIANRSAMRTSSPASGSPSGSATSTPRAARS